MTVRAAIVCCAVAGCWRGGEPAPPPPAAPTPVVAVACDLACPPAEYCVVYDAVAPQRPVVRLVSSCVDQPPATRVGVSCTRPDARRAVACRLELAALHVGPPTAGSQLFTTVIDHLANAPIRSAIVLILRGTEGDVGQRVAAWGYTNTRGEVRIMPALAFPGTYFAIASADGYEPVSVAFDLAADTPAVFDPWGQVRLRSRAPAARPPSADPPARR